MHLLSNELLRTVSFREVVRGHFALTENFYYVRNELDLPLDGKEDAMRSAAPEVTCNMKCRQARIHMLYI